MFSLCSFVDNLKIMGSEQSVLSPEELSLDNLNKLTGISLEMVQKLCDSMDEISLNNDELLEISHSAVMKKIGMEGMKRLHSLVGVGLEELKLLCRSKWDGLLLDVPQLQKLYDSGMILKLRHRELDRLIAMLRQINLTVKEIRKICVANAFALFTDEALIDLCKDGYIGILSTENLAKYCSKRYSKISRVNRKKIFTDQGIIAHLSTNDLLKLCDDKQFLDGATSEEILNVVLGGKYTSAPGDDVFHGCEWSLVTQPLEN